MNAQEIQNIVEARYNRASWLKLLHGIFGTKVKFFAAPTTLIVEKAIASEAVYLGDVTLQDDHKIAVYEVHLSEHVNIERNRAGIRNLLCSQWRGAGFAGAFMLCYRNSESVLRFSYVSESWSFNEDGAYKKESTDALRFTYLLGEGHRSRTAVRQFMELASSGLTLKDVTKAFSVEALSKRFFNEYKEKYEDIVEYVTGKRVVKSGSKWETKTTGVPNKKIMTAFSVFADPEKAVRDYVKKLMGRLVFIQFLQKKGWMGVPASDAAWKNGDKDFVQNLFKNTKNKDSFIDDVLEPLFDDLNTKRENDLVSSEMVGKNIKVPYLNGGLFEKDAQDNTDFPLPKKFMEGLLEFFTQYNFTIDENDPDDAEVGVDPEMLSCIFENLLEDNKEKGAFYTPKEIVQYMCRESLIAHLCNGVKKNETKERIRDFVLTHKVDVLNGDENISEQVDEKLKNVKICDPAIGSGAFPMGLMRELYFCRSAIEGFDHAKAAEIKKHIIQQNIYGVDIEKGAVDIARLRFWLSLIVDEETPHALPNLDFKIMQGNSLLEQYEGVDLSDITYKATKKEKVTGKILDLFDTGEVANKKVISLLKDEFFNCEDHEMKHQIREALKSRMQDLLREKGFGVKLDAIKDVTATDQFFLWHTWFSEVFEQGGFDIVIGNPPYLEARNSNFSDSLKDKLQLKIKLKYSVKNQKAFPRGADLLIFFFEESLSLLNDNGINTFITENSWLSTDYGKAFQNYLLENVEIDGVVDSDYKYFDTADINTVITFFRKRKNKNNYLIPFFHCHGNLETHSCNITDLNVCDKYTTINTINSSNKLLQQYKWGFIYENEKEVLNLLDCMGKMQNRNLADKIEVGQGLNITKDYIQTKSDLNSVPYFISENGAIYRWTSANFFVNKKVVNTKRRIPMLILPRGIGTHFCSFNEISGFSASYVEIYEKEIITDEDKLRLWLFCNSSILWMLRECSGRTNLGGGMLKAEATDLKTLPLCFDFPEIDRIHKIYENARDVKVSTNIRETLKSDIHKQIDDIVFSYFGLPRGENFVVDLLLKKIDRRTAKSKNKK